MRKLGLAAQAAMVARFAWERRGGRLLSTVDRLAEVRRVLRVAYEHTEFYRAKFDAAGVRPEEVRSWRDFAAVPLTTKEELIKAGPAAVVPRKRAGAHVSRSSGSSGKVLGISGDDANWVKDSIIGIDAYRRHFGLRFGDRQLYANTSEYPYRSLGGLGYRMDYFLNLRPIEELVELLWRRRPQVLLAYPSIAGELAEAVRARRLDPAELRLRALVTHSEQSSPAFRAELAAFFGAPVHDEYATEELGRVALTCRTGTYHLLDTQAWCEILDPVTGEAVPAGEPGEIVGTNLINTTMPLIRYRQGDIATLGTSTCQCGAGDGRTLERLLGRRNSFFELPGGGRIASGRLLDWTYDLILGERLDIRQFQLVQTHLDRIRMLLVVGPDYRPEAGAETIRASFGRQLAPGVTVSVETVPRIPKTAAGKHLPIRSELAGVTAAV